MLAGIKIDEDIDDVSPRSGCRCWTGRWILKWPLKEGQSDTKTDWFIFGNCSKQYGLDGRAFTYVTGQRAQNRLKLDFVLQKSVIIKSWFAKLNFFPSNNTYNWSLKTKDELHRSGGAKVPQLQSLGIISLLKYWNLRMFLRKLALARKRSVFRPSSRKQKLLRINFYPRKHPWHSMIGLMKPSRVSRKIKILWFFQCNKAISEKCDRENAILTALEAFYGGNAEKNLFEFYFEKNVLFYTTTIKCF